MIKSMTGYGRAEKEAQGKRISLELKTVNHRHMDVKLKHPRKYLKHEENIRKIVAQYIKRGFVEIFVRIRNTEDQDLAVKVDKKVALTYYNSLNELADLLNLDNDLSLEKLISLPEILHIEEDEEDLDLIWPHYEELLREALEQNLKMRGQEGQNLQADLNKRLDLLKETKEKIAERSPQVVLEYRDKLALRIEELVENKEIISQDKLESEIAFFADRASITEELVRLDSHFQQFSKLLLSDQPVGRKLDFLIQEINREINTIGSKANDSLISSQVVEMKAELEKIREQVQNIE